MKRTALLIVSLAIFTDNLVYSVIIPGIPGIAANCGFSPTSTGWIYGSFSLALVLFTPITGIVTEQYGKRRVMIFGLFGLMLSTLMLPYASSLWQFVLLRFLQGMTAAVNWVAGLALLADYYIDEERGSAMGIAISGSSIGLLLGPVIGGWLYDYGGIHLPFGICAAIVFIDLLMRVFFLKDIDRESGWKRTPYDLRLLFQGKILLLSTAILGGMGVITLVEFSFSGYMEKTFAATATQNGFYFGIFTIANAIGYPVGGWLSDRVNRYTLLKIAFTVMLGAFILMLLLDSKIYILAFLGLMGLSSGFTFSPVIAETTHISEQRGLSTSIMISMINLCFSMGMLSPFFFGWYFGLVAEPFAYLSLGSAVLLWFWLTLVWINRRG